METRTITLGTRAKWRNGKEHRPIGTARCGSFYVEGDGPLIGKLCEQMRDAGYDGFVAVERDGKPVFGRCHVTEWIGRLPWQGEQPAQLRKGAA